MYPLKSGGGGKREAGAGRGSRGEEGAENREGDQETVEPNDERQGESNLGEEEGVSWHVQRAEKAENSAKRRKIVKTAGVYEGGKDVMEIAVAYEGDNQRAAGVYEGGDWVGSEASTPRRITQQMGGIEERNAKRQEEHEKTMMGEPQTGREKQERDEEIRDEEKKRHEAFQRYEQDGMDVDIGLMGSRRELENVGSTERSDSRTSDNEENDRRGRDELESRWPSDGIVIQEENMLNTIEECGRRGHFGGIWRVGTGVPPDYEGDEQTMLLGEIFRTMKIQCDTRAGYHPYDPRKTRERKPGGLQMEDTTLSDAT